MIRLAAFDLDGTTLKNHGELSPENRRAILAAAQQGVLTVPATGRLYSFLPPSLMSLPCIRIGNNPFHINHCVEEGVWYSIYSVTNPNQVATFRCSNNLQIIGLL